MKFGKQLRYECVSEWRSKYISYGKLKKYLRFLYLSSPSTVQNAMIEESERRHTSIRFNKKDGQQQMEQEQRDNDHLGGSGGGGGNGDEHSERSPLLLSENNNSGDQSSPHGSSISLQTAAEREHLFQEKLKEEMQKINEFFVLKEKDIILHYNKLTEHCGMILKDKNPSPKILKNINKAFLELYKGLTMLENFVTLNHLGFSKILKKFDRMTKKSNRENYMSKIERELFYQSKSWRNMKEDVEIDKIATAKKKLMPVSESQSTDYHMMKLGFAFGFSLAALAFVIILFISGGVGQPDWKRFVSVVPIFRGVGIPILAVWFWGVNVFIWDKQRVNYTLIFGFDPRTTVCHRRIFKTASFLTAIWLMMFLLFCGTIMGNFKLFDIPAEVYPPVLVIFFLLVVFFPFRFFHRKSRMVLFVTLGNVIMTPFGSTKFRALYLGDVLTSMVKTIFDWEYTACYYITGDWERDDGARCNRVNSIALPIISGLPLLWRLMQCVLRYRETKNKIHLGNASKYAVGFTVVLFSALNGNYQQFETTWSYSRILWCICFILATLYMYVWDVLVDWSLMWLGSPRPLLRKTLMYKKHIYMYYYALFSNFLFRFAWTLTITSFSINIGINNELFVTILATVELFRRFTWSVFRVENEHITNSLQYHAFDFSDAPWKDEINPPPANPIQANPPSPSASASTMDENELLTHEFINSSKSWQHSTSQYYSNNSLLDRITGKFGKKQPPINN
eukprot:gene8021-9424_t